MIPEINGDGKHTAAKPVPTKAWRDSRAKERKPKRVILKPEEREERERESRNGGKVKIKMR